MEDLSNTQKSLEKVPPLEAETSSLSDDDQSLECSTISEDSSEEILVNPPPPEELGEEESALLRGDAIGKTAYTQRWVLNTLCVITEALPRYLAPDTGISEPAASLTTDSKVMDIEDASVEIDNEVKKPSILELDEEVENAACQLWDMTAEPDIVLHLLNLEAVDILQFATDIISLSRAPRLTEIVIGVVANICCQREGCEKIINHLPLINACIALSHSTDDVPTLNEVFRFLRLLIWHLGNSVPINNRANCPFLIILKSQEFLKVALIFIMKNSLNDTLLSSIIEFIENLMYLWLPDDECYMAAHYAESGLVEGVVEVMRHFLKQWEKSGSQELPMEVNKGILILYSLIGIPASHLISSFDQYEPLLEPILLSYVQHMAKVESTEELLEDENSDRLMYALGLCELLVPTMRNPDILSSIGKLLALTYGIDHHYSTPQSKIPPQLTENIHRKCCRKLRRSRSRRQSRLSQELMETELLPAPGDQESEEKQSLSANVLQVHKTSDKKLSIEPKKIFQSESKELENCSSTEESKAVALESEGAEASVHMKGRVIPRTKDNILHRDPSLKRSFSVKLNNVMESLIDYSVKVIKYCPDLCAVLTALNECHAHEVQLFFRAVRSQEAKLVGDIQEKLLDTGSHNRLVTILADMYS